MIKKNYYYNNRKAPRGVYQYELSGNYGPWEPDWKINFYHIKYAWDRNIRTQNERRSNCAAMTDGFNVRGKRRWKHIRTKWDDPSIGRYGGKSWKDYTKQKKQWG